MYTLILTLSFSLFNAIAASASDASFQCKKAFELQEDFRYFPIKHAEKENAYLLLWAVEKKDHVLINKILDKNENLADLNAINAHGKNAYVLALEIQDACTYGSEEYQTWQEIVERISSVFRFPYLAAPLDLSKVCSPRNQLYRTSKILNFMKCPQEVSYKRESWHGLCDG